MDSKTESEYLAIFLGESGLAKRDDSIEGCVSCPSTRPECNCKGSQSCQQVVRTCQKCAYIKCIDNVTAGGGLSKNVGGIVGGVVGGIFFLGLIVAFIVWNHKKHRKSNRFLRLEAQDKEILEASAEEHKEAADMDGPGRRAVFSPVESTASPRLKLPGATSSYYSSMSKKSRRASAYRHSASTFSSMASSALSRASNIIPIAYIPGVKVRSNSTLITNRQVLDDLQTADAKNTTFGSPLSTMTAVRAVPKLVDVSKSKLNNEVIYEDDAELDVHSDITSGKSVNLLSKADQTRRNRKSINGLTHIVEASETASDLNDLISLGSEDSDDDGDDIFNKHKRFSQISTSPDLTRMSIQNTSNVRPSSSILLDIKVDSSPINPFDDSFEYKK